jgi:hypothetical protein
MWHARNSATGNIRQEAKERTGSNVSARGSHLQIRKPKDVGLFPRQLMHRSIQWKIMKATVPSGLQMGDYLSIHL